MDLYRSFTMTERVGFEDVLNLFEAHGWRLQRIWEPYRVFVREGELPWLIPVHNRKVDIEYVDKFKKFLKDRGKT
jgi:hypothetical protein